METHLDEQRRNNSPEENIQGAQQNVARSMLLIDSPHQRNVSQANQFYSMRNLDSIQQVPSDVPIPQPMSTSPFQTPEDIQFASRQTQYNSLGRAERKRQDKWARKQLKNKYARCRNGFKWDREPWGYRCRGGYHMVTDELLAEGLGGYYEGQYWNGPIYDSIYPQRGNFYSLQQNMRGVEPQYETTGYPIQGARVWDERWARSW